MLKFPETNMTRPPAGQADRISVSARSISWIIGGRLKLPTPRSSSGAHSQRDQATTGHPAVAHRCDRVIYVGEREALGNQAFQLQASGSIQLVVSRNIAMRLGLAAVRTAQRLSEMQRQRVQRCFASLAGNTNQNDPSLRLHRVIAKADDLGIAGIVDEDVRAAWADHIRGSRSSRPMRGR